MSSGIFLAFISKAQMLNREIHVGLLRDYFVSKIAILRTKYTCYLNQLCPSPNAIGFAPILKEKKTRLMNYLPMSHD